jgi:MFS transporter, putative metabolite:H+ symporter
LQSTIINKPDLTKLKGIFSLVVVVAALGYFVDLYDLILFGVVRDSSLAELGFKGQALRDAGNALFNYQMSGFLIGGIIWGILGDTRGRLSVLFATIILYSAANIANGFINDITSYSILRFIAGVGLAGELGAGITLVSETMAVEKRGYGTMMVVVFGALGAVLAAMVGDMGWRKAYIIGGCLGFLLLILRFGTYESDIYKNVKHAGVRRGAFLELFTSKERFFKYLKCILIGFPVWFTIGVLILHANDFAQLIHVQGTVTVSKCVMYSYFGLAAGDLACGFLSQALKSRRKAIVIFLITSIISFIWYFSSRNVTPAYFYFLSFILGSFTGYWAIFVTVASEQFGTNLRATVTTTVPNFVRGAAFPITLGYVTLQQYFEKQFQAFDKGVLYGAAIIGGICILLALYSVLSLKESFSKNLDYIEELNKPAL